MNSVAQATHRSTVEQPHSSRPRLLLALAALGVVYGDIGTSPLYSIRECFHGPHAVQVNDINILGVLSLIFWSLIIVITIKYLIFILRADNRGEGGILSLLALVTPVRAHAQEQRRGIVLLGLFGAALLYADGMITPAISILGAMEGLNVATPVFEPVVEPLALAVVVGLFLVQSHGTYRVGSMFGPIILSWFLAVAAVGIPHILRNPGVLAALLPWHAAQFFLENGLPGFIVLGSVFLVVTGGEALYADLGHFGRRPIRMSWLWVALPALLLNYFGQGAFLLDNAAGAVNPFYLMAPGWALIPLVVLATMAATVASQAVISGAYSLTLQAVQLGYFPRLTIRHTSAEQFGQIYIPSINWMLMVMTLAIIIGFETSSNLAAAYGVAITMTMVITTLLFYVLVRDRWSWSRPTAILVCGCFLVIELSFLGANLAKIIDGGWFALLVGAVGFTVMTTWRRGRQLLALRMRERFLSLELFIAGLLSDPPTRVPGIAVFMSGNPVGTPPALRHNIAHNHILHETVIILCVETAEIPHVDPGERVAVENIGEGFWRIEMKFGFMEDPDIPAVLRTIKLPELDLTSADPSYFLGRETLFASERPGMPIWRERLFIWMSRNAQAATHFFKLPPERVVEIGSQMEI